MDAFDSTLPGTSKTQTDTGEKGFSKIEVLLEATGGLSLSQVCIVTGLEASTIQNWVKRGWVAHPIGKRYEEVHIARILIINALKECIKLEHIAMLMKYLNGSSKDGSSAIIKESVLYNYLVDAMKLSGHTGGGSKGGVENVVDSVISDYHNTDPEARARLRKTLTLMMFACVCTDVKRRTEAMMGQIIKELDGAKPASVSRKTAPPPAERPVTAPLPVTHAPKTASASPARTAPAAAAPVTAAAAAASIQQAAPVPAAAAARVPAPVKPVTMPPPVTPIKITLDEPEPTQEEIDEVAHTRKTISQALREWDISSVEKIIIDHDEEARNNVQSQPAEEKKPVNRPWYIRKTK